MTEQITHVGDATVEPHKEVLIQYRETVTGSPQAIIELHADFREVAPREGGRTLAKRLDDAYRDDALTPEEKGLLDDAANQFGSRLSDEE
ncbi:MAG TPA: hypothetical protein VK902_16425 [Rubrobacter sp.]|nr:hypothetical protein [Rubrobacter sp.]